MARSDSWPALPLSAWQDTYDTLHMWTQIVGKIRMALTPPLNHWWHVTLYVGASGLTTGPIPYAAGLFEIRFDFLRHELQISTSQGENVVRPLQPESVAVFYEAVTTSLARFGIPVEISNKPQEVPNPTPFDLDNAHASYDSDAANRFWRILVSTSKVFERFRGRFRGKCSPTHFFWGSFDLACTRFSGRPAPPRKGAITGPAYSHEVSSAGFWPGGSGVDGPAYYAYTVPKPAELEKAHILPAQALWHEKLAIFILMYDDVRESVSPAETLYDFIRSTYEAGATLGNWNRAALEI
jgi:hypothetical protein